MTSLESRNLLESRSSHFFYPFSSFALFWWLSAQEKELKWRVSLFSLVPFPFSVLRHHGLLLFLLLLTGECLMSLSPFPFPSFGINYSFTKPKRKKPSKTST
jgi:hypothetical protein